jgi:hypothetical protein
MDMACSFPSATTAGCFRRGFAGDDCRLRPRPSWQVPLACTRHTPHGMEFGPGVRRLDRHHADRNVQSV